jgi:hypothetical protein
VRLLVPRVANAVVALLKVIEDAGAVPAPVEHVAQAREEALER